MVASAIKRSDDRICFLLIDTKLDDQKKTDPRLHSPPSILANVRVGKQFKHVAKIIEWKGYFVASAQNTLFWLAVNFEAEEAGQHAGPRFTFELVHSLDLFATANCRYSQDVILKDFDFKGDELMYTDGNKIYIKTISLAHPVKTESEIHRPSIAASLVDQRLY